MYQKSSPSEKIASSSSQSLTEAKGCFDDAIEATSDIASNFLGVSIVVFDALKDASIAAPFPYAFIAASLALQILEAVQGARDNKATFRRLAKDVCEMVFVVTTTLKELVQTDCPEEKLKDESLNNHLENLKKTLEEILEFALKRSKRSRMKRVMSSKSDVGRIQEYRERIKQALDMFGLQSAITVRSSLVQLAARQDSFHEILKGQIPSISPMDPLPSRSSSFPKRSDSSGTTTPPSETTTLFDDSQSHEHVLENADELCDSPSDETASETVSPSTSEKESSTAQNAETASVFSFSGSGISLSGVSFNHYATSHSSVNNVNNSSQRNCGNTYYQTSNSVPEGVPSIYRSSGFGQSRNPFHVYYGCGQNSDRIVQNARPSSQLLY